MDEFKNCPRNSGELSADWRLATVDDLKKIGKLNKIKKILNSWETARLLDGCVKEKYSCVKQHNISKMERMIIIQSVQSAPEVSTTEESAPKVSTQVLLDALLKKKYSEVKLTPQGEKAAVLLSCEDKITEAICFVLYSIVQKFPDDGRRQEELRKLMESLDGKFRNGRTVLHYAVDQPHNLEHGMYVAECLEKNFLMYGKALIKVADKYGRTALHLAALHGNIEVCKFFIQHCGMTANEKDKDGENILHYAVKGQLPGTKFEDLCSLSGVDLIIDSQNAQGKTALHKAAAQGREDMINTLLSKIIITKDNHRYISKKIAGLDNLLGQLERSKNDDEKIRLIFIRKPDLFGQTALLEAARGGHVKTVALLLNSGSRPLHELNSDGRTALHYAVQLSNVVVAKSMAEFLLEERPTDGEKSSQERSLLLWASVKGSGAAEEASPESSNVSARGNGAAEEASPESSNVSARGSGAAEEASPDPSNVSARGSGAAEEASPDPSILEKYLTEVRECTEQRLEELFKFAIELRHDKIARDLIKNGVNIADIKKDEWYKRNKQRVDDVINYLGKINNIAGRTGDQPAIFDSLGRKEVAEGLATLFLNPYMKSPLTVGISGEWGMGKSSLMIQTESILLKTAAQLSFPNILDTEQFPECRQIQQFRKVPQGYEKINKAAKKLLSSSAPVSEVDPLVQFLDGDYQPEYYEVYKLLALRDHKEMFPHKYGDEEADSSSNQYSLRKVPSILTVRYNAWHYQNEQEAWAGLAIETTKAIEESMTMAQKVRCRCRYAWREHGSKIFLELLLPILLALFLSIWVTWAVWQLLTRSKNEDLQALKYGSLPVSVLVVVWTVVRQLLSVLKPISVQIMGYLQLPNHKTNLGYQHQVISDINFLREEIGEKPSWRWRSIALLWTIIAGICRFIVWLFLLCPNTVKDTSIFRSSPPHKDDIRMIVFIDDLDRCQDKVILQVLSAVNLVLAACNISVVLGMDMNMLERVIKGEFPHSDNPKELAEKYIGKMVELQLALPDPSEDELKYFLDQQLGPAFEEGFVNEDAESTTPTEQSAVNGQTGAPAEQISGNGQSSTDHNRHVSVNVGGDNREESQSCLSNSSGIFKSLSTFKISLLQRIRGQKETKGKLRKMSFSMQTIMPNYVMEERVALDYLRKRVTGIQRLPREWKRFLIYHRIAWHILYQRKQVRNEQGWQQQMIIWVFCCWQWKHQIDFIIKNWKKLVHLSLISENGNDNGQLRTSSLKSVIVHCYQKIWLPEHYNEKEEEEEGSEMAECGRESDEKLELEKEEWASLIDAFTLYDVSIKCVKYFQKFRLHCKVGDLAT